MNHKETFRKLGRTISLFRNTDRQYLLQSLILLVLAGLYRGIKRLAGNRAASIIGHQNIITSLSGVKFSVPAVPGDLGVIFDCFIEPMYRSDPEFVPKPGETCLDIGANIGACTAAWCKENPSGRIIAVEPHPITFMRLQRNVTLNNWKNVECLQAAISSKQGTLSFHLIPDGTMATVNERGEAGVSVACLTIDQLLKEREICSVDLCKIDVEGHEIEVLKGALKTIDRIKKLIIEYHSVTLKEDVVEILDRFDFQIIRKDSGRIGLITACIGK
jgi:FkbM family methyltransferase